MIDLTEKYTIDNKTGFNPNLLFLHNEWKNYRYFVLQGGTRSGKTYSTLQYIWKLMHDYNGVRYSVVRATLNALKATTLVDFIEIGQSCDLYNQSKHNLTNNIYKQNGNVIDFFASDDDEKVRGRKRDVLYINEAPEVEWDIVKQFQFRTTSKIIIDYNPSYPESWVYDNILTRNDCAFIRTTYKDNPFLTQGQLDEIEWMLLNDPESYLVYGLGERGQLKGQVYKNWNRCKELPKGLPSTYAIDFGFANSQTCVAEFRKNGRAVYAKEHVYQTELDNLQIGILLAHIGVTGEFLIADSAEPKSIRELRVGWGLERDYLAKICAQMELVNPDIDKMQNSLKSGFNIVPAKKGQDSVDAGIQKVKQHEVFVTEDSHNAWNEYRQYRYAEDSKTGKLLNEPIKKFDHFCDTLRYFVACDGIYY
jgi:phage terminase large subunit